MFPYALDWPWQEALHAHTWHFEEFSALSFSFSPRYRRAIARIEVFFISIFDELSIGRDGNCVEECMPAAGESNYLAQYTFDVKVCESFRRQPVSAGPIPTGLWKRHAVVFFPRVFE